MDVSEPAEIFVELQEKHWTKTLSAAVAVVL
jgi:hypothetical protein